jgi:hypothetical protein
VKSDENQVVRRLFDHNPSIAQSIILTAAALAA